MARSYLNVRQMNILSSSAAYATRNSGAVSDTDMFIFQNDSDGSEMKIVYAKTLQEYFSDVDIDTSSTDQEYTLIFMDPSQSDFDSPSHEGRTLYRDSEGVTDLSYNPSSNLVKVKGSLRLADDGVSLKLGAGDDVVFAHDGTTGLDVDVAGSLVLDAVSGISIGQNDRSAFDLDATTVNISGSSLVLSGSSTATLDFAQAISIDSDAALTLGGAGVDIDADGAGLVTIDGAGGIDIGVSVPSAVDFDATSWDLDATGALTIDSATSIALGAEAAVPVSVESSTLDLDATGNVTLDAGSSSSILIGQTRRAAFDLDATTVNISGSSMVLSGSSTALLDFASSVTIDGQSVDIDASNGLLALDGTSGVNLGTATNGVAVSIGATISETTVNDNFNVTGDTVLGGDLTVNGTTTTVNSTTMTIDDTIMVLGQGAEQTRSAFDLGIIFEQSGSGASNKAFFYDTSEGYFQLMQALSEDGSQTTITSGGSYAKLRLGEIDIDGAADVEGAANLQSTLTVAGQADFNGDVNLGNAATDTVTFVADVDSNIIPDADGSHTLGASNSEWAKLFVNDIESEDGALDLTATQINVSGNLTVSGSVADFYNLDAYANTDYASVDGIMVRDASASTAKHMTFAELGQYLSYGDAASGPGTGLQVSDDGVLSIDVVEKYVVQSDTTSSLGLEFSIADDISAAILDDSFQLYLNGQLQIQSGKKGSYSDYSVSATTVTMVDAIDDNDIVIVRYIKK